MRLFLQDILSPPYRVLAASNGAHALKQIESLAPGRLPELIITDIMMPEMDGFNFIRHLKASPEWQGIPIIALTARAGLDDRLAALRIGVDDYLAKPFEPAELLARITNLLQNYRRRREQPAAQDASFSPG
ncbi:MAG: response regulator transcription factor, partial [Anaerolineales bacterium]|nr:response regulator transcription factor [Anaerolineales bacterium]